MILLKTAWNDFRKNSIVNIFIILQVAVSLIITAVMISAISVRSQYYTPFRDILTSNGIFIKFSSSPNYDSSQMNIYDYLDNDDILQECPDADHIYACHSMFGSIDSFHNGESFTLQSYDDEFIKRYQPELTDGRWLTSDIESNQIEIVVSENDYGVKVGDVLSLTGINYPNSTSFTGKVVGIFQDDSKIIGGGLYDYGNSDMNFNSIYYPFNHTIENQIFVLASYSAIQNITNHFVLLFDTDYVVQPIISSVILTYPDNVSKEQIEADKEKLLQYGWANAISLDELNQNSIAYLLEKAEIFLPIIIILFILASVSSISSSALIVRKNLKNYALYYISGLQWGHCSFVNLLHSIISLAIATIVGVVALLIIPHTKFAYMVNIIWSPYIFKAFAAMIILQLLISMIMPLIIIGKNTPKQILTK
ncbi:hypothetical protein [Ruminococcus sp.]|uniref:ABC transporter permease n=1 Tax=Ruminococcus sp. TaxID=41978 RepID=UPI00300F196D